MKYHLVSGGGKHRETSISVSSLGRYIQCSQMCAKSTNPHLVGVAGGQTLSLIWLSFGVRARALAWYLKGLEATDLLNEL